MSQNSAAPVHFRIFVDFDGTITREDVGAGMFLHFGDSSVIWPIVEKIRTRQLSARDGWAALFEALPAIDEKDFRAFIEKQDVDPTFHQLVQFALEGGHFMCILSDGFDYYIDPLLARENLSDMKRYTNKLRFNESGKMVTEFPYPDEECRLCTHCKRNHVLQHSGDEEISVYIGNGSSDVCPAQFCDLIFAKDDLLKYCEKERVSYTPFFSFRDVVKKLTKVQQKKRFKKRHQALLKRRTVYMQG